MRLLPLLLFCLVTAFAGCTDGAPPADPSTPEPQEDHDPGWPDLEDAPVRPGSKLFDSLEGQAQKFERLQCTAAFIFSDANNSTLYISTASHCVTGWKIGDEILLAQGAARGTVAYCSYGTLADSDTCVERGSLFMAAEGNDFALIRIDDRDRHLVHPALLTVGGPTGLAADVTHGGLAYTVGNTDYRDARQESLPQPLDARRGIVDDRDDWTVQVVFDVTGLPGDSGAPVVDATGQALGVLQYVGEEPRCPGVRPDVNGAAWLPAALAFMTERTGLKVELKTWPLLSPPGAQDLPWPCA